MFCGVGTTGDRARGLLDRKGPALRRDVRRILYLACTVTVAACGGGQTSELRASAGSAAPIELTDDAGLTVRLPRPARRVISLIPSATETLIAMGAGDRLVARTRYDVEPAVAKLPSVGGSVDPSIEAIVSLHPDLVVAWESDKRQVIRQKLHALGVPIFSLSTQDTTDIFRGIISLGRMTGRDSAAAAVAAAVRDSLDEIRRQVAGRPAPSVFYVVYNDPPMTAGPDTFIGQLISLAGARSIFADTKQPWPNVAMEEIVRRDPDIIVVPVGEFRSNALDRFTAMPGWRDLRAVREGHVVSVPADLVSRPSPSIARSARLLASAFQPELASEPASDVGIAGVHATRAARQRR